MPLGSLLVGLTEIGSGLVLADPKTSKEAKVAASWAFGVSGTFLLNKVFDLQALVDDLLKQKDAAGRDLDEKKQAAPKGFDEKFAKLGYHGNSGKGRRSHHKKTAARTAGAAKPMPKSRPEG